MDNIEDKNPKANDGWTPLHSAAWKGHFQVYQAIMDKVEDKNPEDYYGMTPLNLAESNGYTSIIYAIKKANVEAKHNDVNSLIFDMFWFFQLHVMGLFEA